MKLIKLLVIALFSLGCGLYSIYLMIMKDYTSLFVFFGVMAFFLVVENISKPTNQREKAIESVKAPSPQVKALQGFQNDAPKTRWRLFGGMLIGVLLGPFAILLVIGLAELGPSALIDKLSSPSQTSQPIAPTPAPSKEQLTVKFPYDVDQSAPDNYASVLDLAERGNYQAQRNIAYGFVAEPYHNQQKNPVMGCAWYLVVLNSGSQKVDASDQGNANLYCGKLDPDLLETSKYWASKISAKIEENTKFGNLDD